MGTTGGAWRRSVARGADEDALERGEVLHAPAGAADDRTQRVVGHPHGHAELVTHPLVQAAQQRSPTGEHDPAAEDVAGQLGRADVQGGAHQLDDPQHRLLDGPADLGRGEGHRPGQAGDEVAAADPGGQLRAQREGGPGADLDVLGAALAEQQGVLGADVADHGLVDLVAADPHGAGVDDAAEADHGDVGGAAADVDDHAGGGVVDRQVGPDRSSHRLLDDVDPPGAGADRRVLQGPALDAGDLAGHADDDARPDQPRGPHLVDEVAQHPLGDVGVGDDPVPQR